MRCCSLIFRNEFQEMFLPEKETPSKSQDIKQSKLMAETLDIHFKVHGRKNVLSCLSVYKVKPQSKRIQ